MEHIIQEIAETVSNNFNKELQKLVRDRKDISDFILEMKRILDDVGTRLCAEALEQMNEAYRRSPDRKRKWVVKSKADPNTLATIFGEVKYNRTYFQNKRTGEFAYLSDEASETAYSGGCAEPKIIYVHEGWKKTEKARASLKNVRYFSGMYSDSEQLWSEVASYIEAAYDWEAIEKSIYQAMGQTGSKKGQNGSLRAPLYWTATTCQSM